jgi:hypothetical protein
MTRLVTILLLIAILPGRTLAQNDAPYGYYLDAARFSQTFQGGSARIQALGGSNVALGGDITSVSGNPAGLGFYNRSEFSITPGFTFTNYKTDLYDSKNKSQNLYANIYNIGLVINNTNNGTSGWLGGSFGFSVNKINDFDGEFRYNANTANSSIVDYFIESANGLPATSFPGIADATDITTLAYYDYLIGPWNVIDASYPDDEYFSDVTSFMRPSLNMDEIVSTSGNQYQWSLSYGGNLADVLYIGIGVGVVSLNYLAQKSYIESGFDYSADDPTYNPINEIILEEELKISGTGVNGTFGLILRPVSFLRFGASVTTPTAYKLKDSYSGTLAADWNNFYYQDIIGGDTVLNFVEASTANLISQYKLTTPFKASVGAAIFLGKLGFFTADIEYLDYKNIWLNSKDFSMDADNNYISNNFSEGLNLKLGAEIKLDALRFRAGYALDQVPLTADLSYKSSNQRISGGVGILLEAFYADFTIVNTQVNGSYTPYTLADSSQPSVKVWSNNFTGLLTIGYKF